MKKFCLGFLLLVFGFILLPNSVFGCGTKSNHQEKSLKKENKTSKEEKDCCSDSKKDCNNQENKCNGSCNKSSCQSSISVIGFFIPSTNEISIPKFSKVEKLNFFYLENYFPLAYFSIWTPPKIA